MGVVLLGCGLGQGCFGDPAPLKTGIRCSILHTFAHHHSDNQIICDNSSHRSILHQPVSLMLLQGL